MDNSIYFTNISISSHSVSLDIPFLKNRILFSLIMLNSLFFYFVINVYPIYPNILLFHYRVIIDIAINILILIFHYFWKYFHFLLPYLWSNFSFSELNRNHIVLFLWFKNIKNFSFANTSSILSCIFVLSMACPWNFSIFLNFFVFSILRVWVLIIVSLGEWLINLWLK